MTQEHVASAKRFFGGIYGGDPSVVDALAADDVVVTYPTFQRLYGAPCVRGREAVKAFAARFADTWTEPHIAVEEVVAEGDKVVLLWTFRARHTGTRADGSPPTNEVASWGGITLFRFDAEGKISAEVGEESSPGPIGRLNS